MTAKELAEKLLEHPGYMVKVGVEQHLFGDSVYSMEHIEDRMIEVDDSMSTFYLGEYD